ncbi:formylglycine-generating enzyme family protein [Kordiimonas sp.]|uniref:formylglycine-generating enzyme family protein n=1 Tax=Kordiimonas sp. TaxID=1970157 RepID=UPI003A8DEEE9
MRIFTIAAALLLTSGNAIASETLKPGDTFKDCDTCPEMVTLPAGDLLMGARVYDTWAKKSELPQRKIIFRQKFAIGKYEVTVAEYMACVNAKACTRPERLEYWRTISMPISWVSWEQALSFTHWLSDMTDEHYRLPSEAEWEYAARGNTTTVFWWGDEVGIDNANCRGCMGKRLRIHGQKPQPVGQYPANPFGLHDMLGNVMEWTADCYSTSLEKIAPNGAANNQHGCTVHVVRGGAYSAIHAGQARASSRRGGSNRSGLSMFGFRVLRQL